LSDLRAMQRFTALYDAHNRQVYGYAANRVDRHVADEIVGDTFLIAWRRFDELPDPPLPWLLGVARNLIRDQGRQSARRNSIEAELNAWATTDERTGADPADVVIDRFGILTALASLDADDREVLTLVSWQGLTPAQAAGVIGCTRAAYRVRLHRARRRLERAMETQHEIPVADATPTVSALQKGVIR
jgi:RNA polymerase sigma-70 factor (ECF subfamily)